jgi:hypothetical protein
MNTDDLLDFMLKFFGPLLLASSPVAFYLVLTAPGHENASFFDYMIIGVTILSALSIGFYGCYSRLGWFKFMDKYFKK